MGDADPRSRAGAQEEQEHPGRHRRSARQHRLVPHEPHAPALQQREGAARRADGAEPGRLHARRGRRRHQPVEADPGLLHARHAALYGRGRRAAQGQARHRGRQEAARRSRLFRPAGHVPGGAGPAAAQGHGRGDRRPAEEDRHDGRFRGDRLGHRRPAPRLQERRRDRAAGACSTPGTRAPTAPIPAAYIAMRAHRRERPGSAGPTAPRSRRRWRPGSRPRTSPRRRR